MGDYYYELFTGIRLDKKTIESMKIKTKRTRLKDPEHKFDPKTGRPNKQVEVAYWDEEWKPDFDFLAKITDDNRGDFDYDLIFNSGADLLGFKVVSGRELENFYIIGRQRTSLSSIGEVERIDTEDLEQLREQMELVFEPLGLWNDDWFGIWSDPYWS
jgi:hypothetical protein